MLIRFEFENWMSFKDRAIFTMVATKERQHGERLPRLKNKLRLLPISAIYGGNASGKTNFFKALSFLTSIILEGNRPNTGIKLEYFKLDPTYSSKPSSFLIEFLIGDIIYELSFTLTQERFIEEKLIEIASSKEKILYKRTQEQVDLHQSLKDDEYLKILALKTPKNKLFLTHTIDVGAEHFSNIYDWFKYSLILIAPASKFKSYEKFTKEDNPLSHAMNKMLSQLDTGICQIDEIVIPDDKLPFPIGFLSGIEDGQTLHFVYEGQQFTATLKNNIITVKKLLTHHTTTTGETEKFEMSEESDGSRRLIDLLPAFIDICSSASDSVYIIDEVDRSLHTILIRKLLEFYLNSCSKDSRSQLIFTTHDALLIDQSILRRDELWVTDRNQRGESRLYSISEYNSRNDKDIRKSYLQGRFGGIPHIILTEAISKSNNIKAE